MRILIVEGSRQLGDYLKSNIEERGYVADVARDGIEGRAFAYKFHYRACILDAHVSISRPEPLALLRDIRHRRSFPILVITLRDKLADRLSAFDLGANDFMVKPFSFSQIWGRLQALLKRGPHNADCLRVADLEVNLFSRVCVRGQTRVNLTDSEFILLVELMRRHGQVLSRSMLAQRLWGMDAPSESNVIDVNIHRIRSKVDDPFEVKLLHTVRALGYVVEARSGW